MITKLLALIGFGTIIITIICSGLMIIQVISEKIDDYKYEYRYKHRFDKPPIAKCYCKDCVNHGYQDMCLKFKWITADNWFCWDATPRKKDIEEEVQ